MQLPPENPASERFIGYMIIQASAHHEYCLFKIKALLLRMTLKHHSHGAPKPTGQRTDMGDASSAMLWGRPRLRASRDNRLFTVSVIYSDLIVFA
jgi:hypothetical protein